MLPFELQDWEERCVASQSSYRDQEISVAVPSSSLFVDIWSYVRYLLKEDLFYIEG